MSNVQKVKKKRKKAKKPQIVMPRNEREAYSEHYERLFEIGALSLIQLNALKSDLNES